MNGARFKVLTTFAVSKEWSTISRHKSLVNNEEF